MRRATPRAGGGPSFTGLINHCRAKIYGRSREQKPPLGCTGGRILLRARSK